MNLRLVLIVFSYSMLATSLVFVWSLDTLKNLGWIVALAFALCCALRLARFNVALDDDDAPAWKSNFFSGVPAPAGAAIAEVRRRYRSNRWQLDLGRRRHTRQ